MKKRNIIVLIVMAVLLVGSLLFADDINFSESKDVAHNLQGNIVHRTYVDNGSSYIDNPAPDQPITITAFDAENVKLCSYHLVTDINGNYFIDFPTGILSQITEIKVNFHGRSYNSDFNVDVDSSIRIDIVWEQDF